MADFCLYLFDCQREIIRSHLQFKRAAKVHTIFESLSPHDRNVNPHNRRINPHNVKCEQEAGLRNGRIGGGIPPIFYSISFRTAATTLEFSINVKQKSFFPKSLNDAPKV